MTHYEDGYKLYDSDFQLLDSAVMGYGVVKGVGGEFACSYSGAGVVINYASGEARTSYILGQLAAGSIDLAPLQHATNWRKVWIYCDADDGADFIKGVTGNGTSTTHLAYGGRRSSDLSPPDLSGSYACQPGDVVLCEVLLPPVGSTMVSADVTDRRYLIDPLIPLFDNSDYGGSTPYITTGFLANFGAGRVSSRQMYTPAWGSSPAITDMELFHISDEDGIIPIIGRVYHRMKRVYDAGGGVCWRGTYFSVNTGENGHDYGFECIGDIHGVFDDPLEADQRFKCGWKFSATLNDPIFEIGDGVGGLYTKFHRDVLHRPDCRFDGRDISQLIVDNTMTGSTPTEKLIEHIVRAADITAVAGSTTDVVFAGVTTITLAILSRKSGWVGVNYSYSYAGSTLSITNPSGSTPLIFDIMVIGEW